MASFVWLWRAPDFEPAISTFSLTAAVVGLFVDRWIVTRERRKTLLVTLLHELYMNGEVCKDIDQLIVDQPRFRPLPRFYNSVLLSVIASGEFSGGSDATLCKRLHDWQQRSREVNDRFKLSETFLIVHPSAAGDFIKTLATGVVMGTCRQSLNDLIDTLILDRTQG